LSTTVVAAARSSGKIGQSKARRRLETLAEQVLATPEAEQVIVGVLESPLPKAVARSTSLAHVDGRQLEALTYEAGDDPRRP